MSLAEEPNLKSVENMASVASIIQTKEMLSKEIQSVEKTLSDMDSKRQNVIEQFESRIVLVLQRIDEQNALEAHAMAVKELAVAQKEIEEIQQLILFHNETLRMLEEKLAEVQANYDKAIAELEAKKLYLQQQFAYYNELETRIKKLSELIGIENDSYDKKLSSLLEERENLLKRTDLSETTLKERLRKLDELIADYKTAHDASIESLNRLLSDIVAESTGERRFIGKREELLKIIEFEGEYEKGLGDVKSDLHYPTEQDYSIKGEQETWKSSRLDEEYLYTDFLYSLKSSTYAAPGEGTEFEDEHEEEKKYDDDLQKYAFRKFLVSQEQITPSSTTSSSGSSKMELTSQDVEYLKRTFGKSLTLALAEITAVQPKDPVHYLAHWLMKYRYNEEHRCVQEKELMELLVEREHLAAIQRKQECKEIVDYTIQYILDLVEMTVIQRRLARMALLEELMEGEYEY